MSDKSNDDIDNLSKRVKLLEKQLHALYRKLDINEDDGLITDYQKELDQKLNN